MTAEQKVTIRDNAQSIINLAECRLREADGQAPNIKHDLEQIVICARRMFDLVGPRGRSVFDAVDE